MIPLQECSGQKHLIEQSGYPNISLSRFHDSDTVFNLYTYCIQTYELSVSIF